MLLPENQSSGISSPDAIDKINKIALLPDPIDRNLQITACYHELSKAFATRTGGVANWCTFATWASKQAGVTIRGEDLQQKLEEILEKEPAIQDVLTIMKHHSKELTSDILQQSIMIAAIRKLATSAQQRASDAVSKGNKKVFEEIAKEFARFIQNCVHNQTHNLSSIHDFCKTLRPGLPPDGQDYLSRAFTSYYRAIFESDPKTRDELMLLANIEIGFHEQTRLQPEIAESLDAANLDPTIVRNYLTDIILQNKNLQGKLVYFFTWLIGGTRMFKKAIDDLVAIAEKHIRIVITQHLMTLTMPTGNCLHLGEDLVAPYPANLETINSPDLASFWKQLKPSPGSIDGAGCTDWADLKQRIHFIANLFRCYHNSPNLFDPPFSAE